MKKIPDKLLFSELTIKLSWTLNYSQQIYGFAICSGC